MSPGLVDYTAKNYGRSLSVKRLEDDFPFQIQFGWFWGSKSSDQMSFWTCRSIAPFFPSWVDSISNAKTTSKVIWATKNRTPKLPNTTRRRSENLRWFVVFGFLHAVFCGRVTSYSPHPSIAWMSIVPQKLPWPRVSDRWRNGPGEPFSLDDVHVLFWGGPSLRTSRIIRYAATGENSGLRMCYVREYL